VAGEAAFLSEGGKDITFNRTGQGADAIKDAGVET